MKINFNIIAKLKKSVFFKNVTKMMTGTIIGQAIAIIMVPIASRIYGPKFYGDLAVFISAQSICTSFLGFGLVAAIMVENTDNEAITTYKLAVHGTNIIVIILSIILISLSNIVKVIDTNLPYSISILLLGFTVITTNQINMLYAWLNRKGRFNVLLFNPMIMPLTNNGVVIILGLTGFKNFGLYIGLLVGQVITLIHMYKNMDKMHYKLNFHDVKSTIIRNKDFIIYQYPATLINGVVGQLPVQILSNLFGNTIVGYYSMSMRLINIPANLISNSISRVYFKEVSDKKNTGGNAREYTLKICKIVAKMFLIPTIFVLIFGDYLIPFFLGSSWKLAIPYLKIMIVWNLFAIGINCTSGFTSVIGKQKSNMIVSVIKLIYFPLSMILISKLFYNSVFVVFMYAIGYSIINILFYNVIFSTDRLLKNKYLIFNSLLGGLCVITYFIISIIRYI